MYGKGSPSPIPGNAPDNPTKWAELGYQCLHLQMWKVRLAPKNLGDPPHSVSIGELTAKRTKYLKMPEIEGACVPE